MAVNGTVGPKRSVNQPTTAGAAAPPITSPTPMITAMAVAKWVAGALEVDAYGRVPIACLAARHQKNPSFFGL